jgi:hypothetical protein
VPPGPHRIIGRAQPAGHLIRDPWPHPQQPTTRSAPAPRSDTATKSNESSAPTTSSSRYRPPKSAQ